MKPTHREKDAWDRPCLAELLRRKGPSMRWVLNWLFSPPQPPVPWWRTLVRWEVWRRRNRADDADPRAIRNELMLHLCQDDFGTPALVDQFDALEAAQALEVGHHIAVAGHPVQAVRPILPELLEVPIHLHGHLGAAASLRVGRFDDPAGEILDGLFGFVHGWVADEPGPSGEPPARSGRSCRRPGPIRSPPPAPVTGGGRRADPGAKSRVGLWIRKK